MIKVLIVDDEKYARERMRILLEKHPDFLVVGEAESAELALEKCLSLEPQLLFLDIEMPGISGIDFSKEIKSLRIPIIFTTAHADYALEAFESFTIDYLLKPIRPERLEEALKKFHRPILMTHFPVKTAQKTLQLDIESISYFTSKDSYVVVWSEGRDYLTDHSLDELEEKLQHFGFLRCHRSFIVNKKYVKELIRKGDRQFEIRLKVPTADNIKVGRSYIKSLYSSGLLFSKGDKTK